MRSEFEYQNKTVKLAKDIGLNPDEMAIIDLVAAGWNKREAFQLVYRVGFAWSNQALDDELRKIFEKPEAKKRRKVTKDALEVNEQSVEENKSEEFDILGNVSKENMLKELVKAKNKMVIGSKDWLDVNKMIADITRMKQDEVKTEDTTIHFYLPMQCHQCSLYKANNKALKSNK